VPAILIAVAVSAVLGMASYVLVYQPLVERDSSAFVILVTSLGLFIIITNLISIIFGTDAKTLNNVGYGIYFIGDAVVSGIQIAQVILLGAVALLLQLFLKHTGWGQAIRAVTNNPEMARVVGIDTRKVVLMVFAAGSGIACLASACLLLRDGASTHVGFLSVFYAFIAVVVGGVGSIWGAVIGGLALGLLESIGMWKLPSEWQSTIAFLVLFVVILWRPTGLLKGQ
jgi:branched-chain amino acid transport system permease protein